MNAPRAALAVSLAACATVDARPTAPPVPLPPSASAAPATAPSAVAPTKRAEPSRLDEPMVAWSHPTNGAEPRRTARGVWVIEPTGEHAALLDPATGVTVVRAAIPRIDHATLLGGGGDAPTFVAGWSEGRATLARLGMTGGLAWRSMDVGGDAQLSADGTAMAERVAGCATTLRDVESGRRIPRTFADRLVRLHGHGDMAPGTMCRATTWAQLARGGVTLVGHGLYGPGASLSGIAVDGSVAYTIALGDAHPRLVHADSERATFVVLGREVSALTVLVASGRVAWRRVLADAERCGREDGGAFFAESTRTTPTRFLLRACGVAQLVDVATGAVGWAREVGSDAAFLSGVDVEPWDESREVAASGSPAVRALSLDGRELARAALPARTRDLVPLAGGFVATTLGLDGATMIEPGGGARWSISVPFGNAFVRGSAFVALVTGEHTAIVVDGASGRRFAVRDAGPWVLGDVGGRWLASKVEPPRLVAFAR